VNALHSADENRRTGPSGSLESRTKMSPSPAMATSTHWFESQYLLFRHEGDTGVLDNGIISSLL
jgi:hypothetical protein